MRSIAIRLFIILIVCFCIFVGCSTKTPEQRQKEKQLAEERERQKKIQESMDAQRLLDSMPICDGDEDCKAKWEAAQAWVIKNCNMKIQTETSMLIETYSYRLGRNYNGNLSARITKEPLSNGKYKINIELSTDTYNIDEKKETYNCIEYINKFGTIKKDESKSSPKLSTHNFSDDEAILSKLKLLNPIGFSKASKDTKLKAIKCVKEGWQDCEVLLNN